MNDYINKIATKFNLKICKLDKLSNTLLANPKDITNIIQGLKIEFGFEQLLDIIAIDYLHYGLSERNISQNTYPNASYKINVQKQSNDARYGLIYNFLSIKNNQRVKIKTILNNDESILSITSLYEIANWYEREAFDLFGINFIKHPNLIRILTDKGFKHHPMRKDFPVTGLYEVQYDETQKKVIRKNSKIKYPNDTPKVIKG